MTNWRDAVVGLETSIREALQVIDKAGTQGVAVVDSENTLCGIVTDADIRRGILKGFTVDQSVKLIMNTKPKTAFEKTDRESILKLMKKDMLRQMPIINSEGKLLRIDIIDDYLKSDLQNNSVVIMAGGLGTRLSPLTDNCPKPLLKLGDKPILEIIIENLVKMGFKKFYLSVYFRAEMIEEYFGDGSRWGIEISYLKEEKQMGTAGCLSLLPQLDHPILVMNGDLLTALNFESLMDFHMEQGRIATMCVRNYKHEVPFGVVAVEDDMVQNIEEKPSYNFYINGGVYILSPEALKFIPKNIPFDMPTLFANLINDGYDVGAFPVREYWLDIGRVSDLERAKNEICHVFKI
jgi:dTDP-glucose pyrophosphorylase